MKKQSITWDGDVITIAYGNGKAFKGNCQELPSHIYQPCAAAKHGVAQKLGDAKSGGSASEKYAEVQKIWASLRAGEWNRRGGDGDAEFMKSVFLVLAEMAKAANPTAQAAAWYERYQGMSPEARDALMTKPAVRAAVQKVKADHKLAVDHGQEFDPFTA